MIRMGAQAIRNSGPGAKIKEANTPSRSLPPPSRKGDFMKWAKTAAMLALGVWLALSAALSLLRISLPLSRDVLNAIQLAAGLLILLSAAE
jgi:hypothetical protein